MSANGKKSYEIKGLTNMLEKCLKRKVISYSLKCLTKPGDNFGSCMQSLDVAVAGEDKPDKVEALHLVCKSAVTNPYLVQIFQPELSFVKENRFYSDIIPAMKIFEESFNVPQAEQIDAFIGCIGSRISLNSDAISADADAVLILENIKLQHFVNEDRYIGFDTPTTLAILKSLAKFHAILIAMRRVQPELFKNKVDPYLKVVNWSLDADEDDSKTTNTVCDELKLIYDLDDKLLTRVQDQLRICDKHAENMARASDTPYTTVVHRDLWCNNIMILKDADDKPLKVKFYDFQEYFYQTFVCDLIFFLFTSVRMCDLAKHFTLFIDQYHLQFINMLKLLDCPLDDYTYDKMWNEIRDKAKMELLHILFMTKVCLVDTESTPSLDDVTPDLFLSDKPPTAQILSRWKCVIELFKQNEFI